MRALALTWLFSGLRGNEIVRLRVGLRALAAGGTRVDGRTRTASGSSRLLVDVPIHMTGTSFTKPVDAVLGHAIDA